MRADELIASAMARADAHTTALREFGDVARYSGSGGANSACVSPSARVRRRSGGWSCSRARASRWPGCGRRRCRDRAQPSHLDAAVRCGCARCIRVLGGGGRPDRCCVDRVHRSRSAGDASGCIGGAARRIAVIPSAAAARRAKTEVPRCARDEKGRRFSRWPSTTRPAHGKKPAPSSASIGDRSLLESR